MPDNCKFTFKNLAFSLLTQVPVAKYPAGYPAPYFDTSIRQNRISMQLNQKS
jgi:hypothetical protein